MKALLIFDLDGTLFQAKPVYLRADLDFLSEYGVPAPDENTLLKYTARGLDMFLRALLPEDMDIPTARECFIGLVCKAIVESGELYPGISEMLRKFRGDGHELAVCSFSPEEYVRTVLEHTGIAGIITRYNCADTNGSKAEAVRALLRPGVPAIVIGDTHGEMEAARENGLPFIAAAYGYGNKAMLAAADHTANTPDEINDCIGRAL